MSWNNYQEERWAKWDEPAIKAAVEAGGGTYISNDAKSSAETQASNVENLISQGANVLVVLAQDGTAIKPAVANAIANGVPVIAYDRLIEDPRRALHDVRQRRGRSDARRETIFDLVPKGNYVIIKGNSADANADFLRAGWRRSSATPSTAGDITIVGETYTDNWDPALAQTEMEQFLTDDDNDVQAVLVRERRHGRRRRRRPRGPGPRRPGAGVRPGRRPGRPQPGRARHADGERLEGLP